MSDDFSLHFWTWYATDEYGLVFEVCRRMRALDFLQSPASLQSSQIPYCPACETWSEMMLPVHDLIEDLPPDLPLLAKNLKELWHLCEELPPHAFGCDDFEMFNDPAWEPLRTCAKEALQRMDWANLQGQIDAIERECRQKLSTHKHRL